MSPQRPLACTAPAPRQPSNPQPLPVTFSLPVERPLHGRLPAGRVPQGGGAHRWGLCVTGSTKQAWEGPRKKQAAGGARPGDTPQGDAPQADTPQGSVVFPWGASPWGVSKNGGNGETGKRGKRGNWGASSHSRQRRGARARRRRGRPLGRARPCFSAGVVPILPIVAPARGPQSALAAPARPSLADAGGTPSHQQAGRARWSASRRLLLSPLAPLL
jgi:hypothetical protein